MLVTFICFLICFESLKPGNIDWESFLGHLPTCLGASFIIGIVVAYIVREQLEEQERTDTAYDWFLHNLTACRGVALKSNDKGVVCCYVLATDGERYPLASGREGAEQYKVLTELLKQKKGD